MSRLLRLLGCGVLTLAALAALAAPAGAATTYTWNQTGSAWNSSTSWNPNGVPTVSDFVVFNSSGPHNAVTVAAGDQFNTIQFDAGAGAYTFSGGRLDLDGSGVPAITV